ncbi:MAG: EamA family transporter [Rhodobacterales bacterium]|nr:MAG: EamA family transporter [Rhodobacterales bacterium]
MDNLRGALLMVFAMAGFAVEDALIKILSRSVPMGMVMICLGAGGALGFALLARRAGVAALTRCFWHPMVLLRNLAEIAGTAAFVSALSLIPLSLATALLQTNPLFVSLGAIVFFGERVGWQRWVAIGVGLAGVLVILRPGFASSDPKALLAVFAAFSLAMRDLALRHCPAGVHPRQLSAWGFAMLIPIGLAMLAFDSGPVRPGLREAGLMLAIIALGMGGYHALTHAMRAGEVGVVTPFRYVRVVFGFALAWAVFGERPDLWMFVGAAIVVGAGLHTLLREGRAARRVAKAAA